LREHATMLRTHRATATDPGAFAPTTGGAMTLALRLTRPSSRSLARMSQSAALARRPCRHSVERR